MNIVTKSYTIDRNAYLALMFRRQLLKRFAAACAILLALFTGVDYLLAHMFVPLWTLGRTAVLLVLLLGFRWILLRIRVFNRKNAKAFDLQRVYTINDFGVEAVVEGGAESKLPWSHFVSAERRAGITLLFTSPIIHLIVPDSAFQSQQDQQEFLNFLRSRGLLKD